MLRKLGRASWVNEVGELAIWIVGGRVGTELR